MKDQLVNLFGFLDKDVPLWNVVSEVDLEDLRQVLELRCILPIFRAHILGALAFLTSVSISFIKLWRAAEILKLSAGRERVRTF